MKAPGFLFDTSPFEHEMRIDCDYPGFAMRFPRFVDDGDRRFFASHNEIGQVIRVDNRTEAFAMSERKYRVGEIRIVHDVLLKREFECGWPTDYAKLRKAWSHSRSLSHQRRVDGDSDARYIEKAVYLIVPQSATLQHFVDGVIPKIAQVWPYVVNDPDISVIVDLEPQRWPVVVALWKRLVGASGRELVTFDRSLRVGTLYFTCITPPLHPILWHYGRELLRLPTQRTNGATRILYMSRSTGSTYNGGRRVLNDAAMLAAIGVELRARSLAPEMLVVFDHKLLGDANDPTFLERSSNYFRDVMLLFGPHGGAFTNLMFAPYGACVIEIQPQRADIVLQQHTFIHSAQWHQYYWQVLAASKSSNDDMLLDVEKFMRAFREAMNMCVSTAPRERREG